MKNLLKSLAQAGAEVLTKDQQKRITGGKTAQCCCPGAGCGSCDGSCSARACGRDGCSAGSY